MFREAGPSDAASLALLWTKAGMTQGGQEIAVQVEESAVDALRVRLAGVRARAVLGFAGEEPVVGCFASEAIAGGHAVPGRAHVSGVAVDPGRWGEGLASEALGRLEDLLVSAGYVTAQLQVLEENGRARSLYEHLGWRLVRLGEPHPLGPHALYEKPLSAPGTG